jgi:excisionase family DNA binding protein
VKHPETNEKFAQRLLTVKEAGSYLALGPCRVRALIHRGEVSYVKLGRRILLDLKDLDALVETKKRRECCTR